MSKYPAKSHAFRTLETLKKLANSGQYANVHEKVYKNSIIYLKAPELEYWPNSDITVPFRQDRYFHYLSGVSDIPGCHVTYETKSQKLTLYLPPVDPDDVMWSGLPISLDEALEKYDVDEVKYSTELESLFERSEPHSSQLGKQPVGASETSSLPIVLTVFPENAFGIQVEPSSLLKEALDETRLFKDKFEIELMKKAALISDNSHFAVMSSLPIEHNEGHIHAEFVYHTMRQGSKVQAYDPICCSGSGCGTLHYNKNDKPLDGKQLVLIDAGAEWKTYASDVTRTFPINGHWTTEARAIYDTVLDMQTQAMHMVKPGVSWEKIHERTHRILIEHFLLLGIFHNGSVDEIFDARVSVPFYPHGLGHMLGMDVHDVGGKPNYEDPDPMFRYLRIRRTLQANMVVTVEPGCYFNEFLLEPVLKDATKAKFINQKVLDKYMPVGGVRIEDDVLVTETGFENFTGITSDADEISKIVLDGISGPINKPKYDQ